MFFKNILENSINYVVCILSHVFRSIASKTSLHTIVYYSKAIRQVLIRVHWIIWLSFYVERWQAYIRIIAITTALNDRTLQS